MSRSERRSHVVGLMMMLIYIQPEIAAKMIKSNIYELVSAMRQGLSPAERKTCQATFIQHE